jgi:ribosomal protein S27E
MPAIKCPHCGLTTFTIRGWADADTCPSCGSSLQEPDPRAMEEQVVERLYGGNGRIRHGNGAADAAESGEGVTPGGEFPRRDPSAGGDDGGR